MKLAEVVLLYETNWRSIPDMLRQAADSIETEADEGYSPTKAMAAVQISKSGEVQIYGWGETNELAAIGLLQLGLHKLTSQHFG
jgi:hypothetical protein